jgi:hypothetical protein
MASSLSHPADNALMAARNGRADVLRESFRALRAAAGPGSPDDDPILASLRVRYDQSGGFNPIPPDDLVRRFMVSVAKLGLDPLVHRAWIGRKDEFLRIVAEGLCGHWVDARERQRKAIAKGDLYGCMIAPPLCDAASLLPPPLAVALCPLLLEAGADPLEADRGGMTPFLRTAWRGEPALLDLFWPADADERQVCGSGYDAFYCAVEGLRSSGKAGDPARWADHLRRLMPTADFSCVDCFGKNALFFLLDARRCLGERLGDEIFLETVERAGPAATLGRPMRPDSPDRRSESLLERILRDESASPPPSSRSGEPALRLLSERVQERLALRERDDLLVAAASLAAPRPSAQPSRRASDLPGPSGATLRAHASPRL